MTASTGGETAGATRPVAARALLALGRFFFHFRDYLAPLGLLALIFASRPHPFRGSEELDLWADACGIAVAFAGQVVRALVIGYAYIKRGGVEKKLAAPRLVTEGIYAHSRNPVYVGNVLLLFGLAIIYHTWVGYLLLLPVYVFAFYTIIKAEEDFLLAKFGDEYRAYCRRVNRILPGLHGFGATLRGMPFDWKRVVRKDYGTTFSWLTSVLVLLAAERIAWHGAAGARSAAGWMVPLWSGIAILYAMARWLKKTRRLHPS